MVALFWFNNKFDKVNENTFDDMFNFLKTQTKLPDTIHYSCYIEMSSQFMPNYRVLKIVFQWRFLFAGVSA